MFLLLVACCHGSLGRSLKPPVNISVTPLTNTMRPFSLLGWIDFVAVQPTQKATQVFRLYLGSRRRSTRGCRCPGLWNRACRLPVAREPVRVQLCAQVGTAMSRMTRSSSCPGCISEPMTGDVSRPNTPPLRGPRRGLLGRTGQRSPGCRRGSLTRR